MSVIINNIANSITAIRVLLTVMLVIDVYSHSKYLLFSVAVIGIIFLMDAVDGIVARKLNTTSMMGSFLDIFADRVVEFILLAYFYKLDLVPNWFVIPFYIRIFLSDFSRFGAYLNQDVKADGIILGGIREKLVLTHLSRGFYGVVKLLLFAAMFISYYAKIEIQVIVFALIVITLSFNLVRGMPIIIQYLPVAIKTLLHRATLLKERRYHTMTNQLNRRFEKQKIFTVKSIPPVMQITLDFLAVSFFTFQIFIH